MPLSQILDTGVYAVFIGFTVIGLALGYVRGLSRQTMKFVTVAAAFVISLIFYAGSYEWLYNFLYDKSLFDLLDLLGVSLGEDVTNLCSSIPGEDIIYIVAVPMAIVIVPVLFLLTFLSISVTLILPFTIICGVLGFTPMANSPVTRILGAVVGGIQGVLISAVVLSQFSGMVGVANEAVTYAENGHPGFKNTEKISKLYHENLDLVYNNPVLQAVEEHCGFLYDGFTKITVEDESVNVVQVVDDSVEIYVLLGELDIKGEFKYQKLTDYNKEIIDQMIKSFGHDKYMTVIVSDLVSAFGKSTQTGVFSPDFDEPLRTIAMSLFDILASSDDDNIEADLHTVAEVYYLLSDVGAMAASNPENVFQAFLEADGDGNTAFTRLESILSANERFAGLGDMLTTIAMDMLFQNSGIDKEVVETVEEVKDSLNNILSFDKNSETYEEDVKTELSTTLTNNGIELEDEQMDELSKIVADELKKKEDVDEITDADLAKFMAEYYNIYANGGKLPDGFPEGLPEDFPGTGTGEGSGEVELPGATEGSGEGNAE